MEEYHEKKSKGKTFMERAFLESFGLEKSQIDQVLNQHSKEIGQKVNEISKLTTDVESLTKQLENKGQELATANSTIDGLKKSNKDNENLQQKIDEYKNQMKSMQEQFESEKIKTTVLSELRLAGARDPELVYTLIDQDQLGLNKDGKVIGYDEQIKSLTGDEAKSYLFEAQESPETRQPEINVERGGYNPVQGEPDTVSYGRMLGEQFAKEREQAQDSAASFWAEMDR